MIKQTAQIPTDYKSSPLGPIPKDWEVKRLGDCTNLLTNGFVGMATPHYTEDNDGIIYIQGYNVIEGGFNLKGIKKVTKAFHEKNKKSILSEGDLLTIQTGDIGLTTIVPKELEGSNCHALIISRFKDLITPRFMLYYYNSPIGHNRFHIIETGSTMKHINTGDLYKFLIPVPPLPEQHRIVSVLSLWDSAIAKQTALIEKLNLRKRGLMQQLLTGKKRLKGFSGEWKTVELGDVLSYIQPTKHLVVSENYNDTNNTPVLTAGKTFILGYTNETTGIFNDLPAIIFDDFTTESKYVTFPFKAKSSAMKILKAHNSNLYFIFCAMQMIKYSIGGHERHWISKYSHLTLKTPLIEEQNAIASVLINADKEIELANEKLVRLQEEKRGLMQVLLTGKKRVK